MRGDPTRALAEPTAAPLPRPGRPAHEETR